MQGKTRAMVALITTSALIATGTIVGGSTAAAAPRQAKVDVGPTGTDVVQRAIPFDHPTSLGSAAKIASSMRNAIAVTFEAGGIQGQWATTGSISVKDFLAREASVYGAVPRATSIVVTDTAENLAKDENAQAPIATGKPAFVGQDATKVPAHSVAELQSNETSIKSKSKSKSSLASPNINNPSALNWAPEDAFINVTQDGSLIDFNETYQWYGAVNNGNDPRYTYSDFGLEFGLDAYTNNVNYQGGTRDFCNSGFKDQPFAKDYGWSYTVQTVVPGERTWSRRRPV
ncbi:hypothetical protein GCM10025881_17170 [Pseudolysinimonas kribbensis]|uniref:Uncharacterized protein n=2 Tax=Pseudolysinimonas kribbensis TaxID=433641 RepID=A0ABQ6K5R6_9MICO|nr:hypothetical protein GCM10025881_17170 [Pseudolysinimonas kribbensis]